ncbi:MAG: hypothetical protein QOF30_1658 [Acidimicrobiaceae bacterium]|jgi:hypothetical protein|nr:hypothetical protein [Acidimicrobiaceae bacterium]
MTEDGAGQAVTAAADALHGTVVLKTGDLTKAQSTLLELGGRNEAVLTGGDAVDGAVHGMSLPRGV